MAVIELRRDRVLERVVIPGLDRQDLVGYELAVHGRPGVVRKPALEARHERAQDHLQEDQADDPGSARCALALVIRARAGRLAEIQRQPDHEAQNHEGDSQVQRQPVLADVDALDEARLDHEPADGALQAAEHRARPHISPCCLAGWRAWPKKKKELRRPCR